MSTRTPEQLVDLISNAIAYPLSAAQRARAAAVVAGHISTAHELRLRVRFWRRLCAMLGTLLLACAIVIVLQYLKLP